jgi:hypothetical protein
MTLPWGRQDRATRASHVVPNGQGDCAFVGLRWTLQADRSCHPQQQRCRAAGRSAGRGADRWLSTRRHCGGHGFMRTPSPSSRPRDQSNGTAHAHHLPMRRVRWRSAQRVSRVRRFLALVRSRSWLSRQAPALLTVTSASRAVGPAPAPCRTQLPHLAPFEADDALGASARLSAPHRRRAGGAVPRP